MHHIESHPSCPEHQAQPASLLGQTVEQIPVTLVSVFDERGSRQQNDHLFEVRVNPFP
jgi:hypothetical protein